MTNTTEVTPATAGAMNKASFRTSVCLQTDPDLLYLQRYNRLPAVDSQAGKLPIPGTARQAYRNHIATSLLVTGAPETSRPHTAIGQ